MAFELESPTKAKVIEVLVLSQKNRQPDEDPGAKLSLQALVANDVLIGFDGILRGMLFMRDARSNTSERQGTLDGVAPISDLTQLTPVGSHIKSLKWHDELTGYRLRIDHGTGGPSDIIIDDCVIDNFRLQPQEGGTVLVKFDLESANISERTFGKLAKLKSVDVQITLLGPDVTQSSLDGIPDIPPGPAAAQKEKEKDAGKGPWPFGNKGDKNAPATDATSAFLAVCMEMPMNELREGLPDLPKRMRYLPVDSRGYPVPWFVAWINGKPDHRIMDARKMPSAVRRDLCWMCGQKMGVSKAFTIGPISCISRAISEPPSHPSCARFAVRACPFLTRPRAQRREAGMPDHAEMAGVPMKRNPGVICIWVTRDYKIFRSGHGGAPGNEGWLFEIGDPESMEWYAEGRRAQRAEVDASMVDAIPFLTNLADQEDEGSRHELLQRMSAARGLLDAFLPSNPETQEVAS